MKLIKPPRNIAFGLFITLAISLGVVGPAWAPGGKPSGGKSYVETYSSKRSTKIEDAVETRKPTGSGEAQDDIAPVITPLIYESLKEQLENSTKHRTLRVFEDMPHLRVRATDSPAHDDQVASIAREILEPMLGRPASMAKTTVVLTLPTPDSRTEKLYSKVIPIQPRTKGSEFLGLLDSLSVKKSLEQGQRIELLKKWAGELVVIIGHRNPNNGYFEYENGTKVSAVDIKRLEEDGATAKVLILFIGCQTARSTSFGSEHNLNSLDVVKNVAAGLELLESGPQTLGTFYKGLATRQMALSMDIFRFKDLRTFDPLDKNGDRLEGEVRVPPIAKPRLKSNVPQPFPHVINDEYMPQIVDLAQPCPRLDKFFNSEAIAWIFFGGSALLVTIILVAIVQSEVSDAVQTMDEGFIAGAFLAIYLYGKWAFTMLMVVVVFDMVQHDKYFVALFCTLPTVAVAWKVSNYEKNDPIVIWCEMSYRRLILATPLVMLAYHQYCGA
ncbi:MAG: hypothetical protein KIS97_08355 [Nitrospira sp.]|nr:hypothetical protein [Nitrospira sp.]